MQKADQRPPAEDDPVRVRATEKAAKHLLPFLILMYMIAFLDRSNVGLAKQALHADLGISDAVFAFGAGVFFVGYALFEVPSNLILYRVGARRWMARIMVTWGLVSAATMFVRGDHSFIALRCLLGLAEAGFFPGVMLYLTFWFPQKERMRVLGLYYFGYPLAMTLGSPLSGALFALDGVMGLRGWQWMFLIEGGLAVIVGIMTLFVLPNGPADVTWLDDEEKATLSRVLSAEEKTKTAHGHGDIWKLLRSPKLLQFLALYALMQVGSYGVVFYLPEQVSGILHQKIGFWVSTVSAVPWACAVISTILVPRLVQKLNAPRAGLIVCLVTSAVALVVSGSGMAAPALLGLCLAAASVVTVQAIFWNFPLAAFSGLEAAGAIALINSVGNLGGFAAPNIRSLADHLWRTPSAGLYAVAAAGVLALSLAAFLPRRGQATQPAV
ncbi:sugar phosphate permease [Neoasaia chiangmaiensis NBRC 101099]|uniref:MFS transporter n=1 Tax=Neoasaia chiangmaiensis TaxID=320497 RepID=A0A1U9KS03_9PROT|nr:MFS transporter [Neoasaia chiangmaiensis]AQS88613.1 MFS transporter [Neoasaia chiangmaiensis]GBR36103.1 sugar phosphate permease [Neoasaia chiangmaiensis NBRC 101099]GEN15472.1 MFS transporter [Neoasaia chiangmaiensis]